MPVLNWIGKDKVVNHAASLPFRTLKPDDALSFGQGEHMLVEGDNLEALKALMPFYYGKVKCIYIDPPYNTGNNTWVYNDRVDAPQIKEWFHKVVGEEGKDLCRHDKWLCMMYPRLKLLRELLKEDGAIFVSIDDNEQHHLRLLMDEIFGANNFVANIIWQKNYSPRNDAKHLSDMHDHIVLYARKKEVWRPNLIARGDKQNAHYKYDDGDGRGSWRADNLSVKTISKDYLYEIINPNTGQAYQPPAGRAWMTSQQAMQRLVAENRLFFGKDGKGAPQLKRYLSEVKEGVTPQTLWFRDEVGDNQEAKKELNLLLGEGDRFETPKPTRLLKRIIALAAGKDDIILDSFAGSGTTGQAVLEMNAEDGGNRKCILIEMEPHIAANITARRLQNLQDDSKDGAGAGFRYLRLNGELFSQDGLLNPDAQYSDLATYIFYTETHQFLDSDQLNAPYIGSHVDTHYYLLSGNANDTTLDQGYLQEIGQREGIKIVYADRCLVDEEELVRYQVTFRQIPYELQAF